MSLSIQDKILQSKKLKQEGNALFTEKKFKKALITYSKVFAYLNGIISQDSPLIQYSSALGEQQPQEDEIKEINEIKISCWSNIAICHSKLGNSSKSLEYSNKVLQLNQNHVKANFYKGLAYLQTKDLENAKKYLLIAAKLDPNNVSIRNELKNLQLLLVEQNQSDKKKFSKMFG